MNCSIIVRADHYPNGLIIPTAYVTSTGESRFIRRVTSILFDNDSTDRSHTAYYHCVLNDGSQVILSHSYNAWEIAQTDTTQVHFSS